MPPVAQLPSTCATCKRAGVLEVMQVIRGGQLHWRERFSCECGHGFEGGAVGLPTPAARRALLALGRAEVWVDSVADAARSARVLAAASGLAEPTSQTFTRLPTLAYDGTRVEAEFIAEALGRAGSGVRVITHLPEKQP